MWRPAIIVSMLMTSLPAHAAGSCDREICFQPKAKVGCLTSTTWGMLDRLVARIGVIEVASACDGRHARRSAHYRGEAIDFRPLQATPRAAIAVLKTMPEVGGIGSYSNGLVHADVAPRKLTWFRHLKTSRYASLRMRHRVAQAR